MMAIVMTICVMVNPRCCVDVLWLGFIYAITSGQDQSWSSFGKRRSGENYVEIPRIGEGSQQARTVSCHF